MTTTKTFLISGASAGFGAAFVERFVGQGHRVIAAARREDRLHALIAKWGDRVLPLVLDIQDRHAVAAAVAGLPAAFATIDCLVNNAGLALGMELAQNSDVANWDHMIDTNCKGLAYLTHAVLPQMVARKAGHIVNLGSVAATYPYPGGNIYGATKAFVRQFSLNLRADLHGTGVRVSCVEPGMCGGTEFSEVRFGGDKAKAAKLYEGMQPLTPHDIAATVDWLTSQPSHVNVNTIELMPVAQSFAGFPVART